MRVFYLSALLSLMFFTSGCATKGGQKFPHLSKAWNSSRAAVGKVFPTRSEAISTELPAVGFQQPQPFSPHSAPPHSATLYSAAPYSEQSVAQPCGCGTELPVEDCGCNQLQHGIVQPTPAYDPNVYGIPEYSVIEPHQRCETNQLHETQQYPEMQYPETYQYPETHQYPESQQGIGFSEPPPPPVEESPAAEPPNRVLLNPVVEPQEPKPLELEAEPEKLNVEVGTFEIPDLLKPLSEIEPAEEVAPEEFLPTETPKVAIPQESTPYVEPSVERAPEIEQSNPRLAAEPGFLSPRGLTSSKKEMSEEPPKSEQERIVKSDDTGPIVLKARPVKNHKVNNQRLSNLRVPKRRAAIVTNRTDAYGLPVDSSIQFVELPPLDNSTRPRPASFQGNEVATPPAKHIEEPPAKHIEEVREKNKTTWLERNGMQVVESTTNGPTDAEPMLRMTAVPYNGSSSLGAAVARIKMGKKPLIIRGTVPADLDNDRLAREQNEQSNGSLIIPNTSLKTIDR